MSEEIVDLVSDDEIDLSPVQPVSREVPAPRSPLADGGKKDSKASVALKFDPMFDSDDDSPPKSRARPALVTLSTSPSSSPSPLSDPVNIPDVKTDSSEESDEEINALAEHTRRANTVSGAPPASATLPRKLRLMPTVPTPSSARKGNRVVATPGHPSDDGLIVESDDSHHDSDSDWEKENDVDGISEAFLDRGPRDYVNPSMSDSNTPYKGDASVNNREVMELVRLNQLSSDATKELPTPTEMNVVLLKHQRQALAWMQNRESDAEDKPPDHPRGGILADDQGFGKTLSVISLMLTNKPPIKEGATQAPAWGNLVICPTSIMYQWAAELENRIDAPYRPRVLVYHGAKRPKDPYLLVKYDVVITSYGTARQEFPKVLERDGDRNPIRHRKKGPLYKLKWFRVILDEAQAIKNHRGETFQACTNLHADRRWSLTGTPIQNTIDDIYSQFLFIRYFLVADYKEWRLRYKRPMESSRGPREALFKRFQTKLGVVLLRRAKSDKIDGKPVIDLPKRTVTTRELELSPIERSYYHAQEVRALQDLAKFGIEMGFTTALVILLRLRQACGHPVLCDWYGDRQFDFSDNELDTVVERMKTRCMFNQLPPETQARLAVELGPGTEVVQNCPICMEAIEENGIVTKCGHIFCSSDFEQWNQENESCPYCRADLGGENEKMALNEVREEVHAIDRAKKRREEVKAAGKKVKKEPKVKFEITIGEKRTSEPSSDESPTKRRCKNEDIAVKSEPCKEEDVKPADTKQEEGKDDESGDKKSLSSTKIMALLSEYKTIVDTTDDKVLCYSQWTRMLDLVEEKVNEEGYEYVRLDGSMTPDDRTAAIRTFNSRSKCRLFLISMQAGSTGLNLTAANRIFLLDSWWNPTVEEQAIDRAHRIGQTKDVDVVRFKISNSVEDRILLLQERKRELIDGALGVEGLKTMGRRRLTFQDVLGLFTDVANNVAARAGQSQNHEIQALADQVRDSQLNMDL